MSRDEEQRRALKDYGARFDNLDLVMMPELLASPNLAAFLRKCIETGQPATKQSIEAEFGPIAWDW